MYRNRMRCLAAVLLAVPAWAQTASSPADQVARIRAAMEQSLSVQKKSVARQLESQRTHQQVRVPVAVRSTAMSAETVMAGWPTPRFNCKPVSAEQLAPDIAHAAAENGLSAELLRAVAWTESAFIPCAVSPKGAAGLMQIMPATARDLSLADPMDPKQSLSAGAKYLGQLLARYGGDVRLALSAYNAGPGVVDRYQEVPPIQETQDYVLKILGRSGTLMPAILPIE